MTSPTNMVITLHDFEGMDTNKYISFKKGEEIGLLKVGKKGWSKGRLKDGKEGYFPSSYCIPVEDSLERQANITDGEKNISWESEKTSLEDTTKFGESKIENLRTEVVLDTKNVGETKRDEGKPLPKLNLKCLSKNSGFLRKGKSSTLKDFNIEVAKKHGASPPPLKLSPKQSPRKNSSALKTHDNITTQLVRNMKNKQDGIPSKEVVVEGSLLGKGFLGSEYMSWLLSNQIVTKKKEVVKVGNLMLSQGKMYCMEERKYSFDSKLHYGWCTNKIRKLATRLKEEIQLASFPVVSKKLDEIIHKSCFEGKKLMDWLEKNGLPLFEKSKQKCDALQIAEKLLRENFVYSVSNSSSKQFELEDFYRLPSSTKSSASKPQPKATIGLKNSLNNKLSKKISFVAIKKQQSVAQFTELNNEKSVQFLSFLEQSHPNDRKYFRALQDLNFLLSLTQQDKSMKGLALYADLLNNFLHDSSENKLEVSSSLCKSLYTANNSEKFATESESPLKELQKFLEEKLAPLFREFSKPASISALGKFVSENQERKPHSESTDSEEDKTPRTPKREKTVSVALQNVAQVKKPACMLLVKELVWVSSDNKVVVYNLEGQVVEVLPEVHKAKISSMTTRGKFVWLACEQGHISVWLYSYSYISIKHQFLCLLTHHQICVRAIGWIESQAEASATSIVSGDISGHIQIWNAFDMSTQAQTPKFVVKIPSSVTSLLFLPHLKQVWVGSFKTVHVHSSIDFKNLCTFTAHSRSIDCMIQVDDVIWTSSDEKISLWKPERHYTSPPVIFYPKSSFHEIFIPQKNVGRIGEAREAHKSH